MRQKNLSTFFISVLLQLAFVVFGAAQIALGLENISDFGLVDTVLLKDTDVDYIEIEKHTHHPTQFFQVHIDDVENSLMLVSLIEQDIDTISITHYDDLLRPIKALRHAGNMDQFSESSYTYSATHDTTFIDIQLNGRYKKLVSARTEVFDSNGRIKYIQTIFNGRKPSETHFLNTYDEQGRIQKIATSRNDKLVSTEQFHYKDGFYEITLQKGTGISKSQYHFDGDFVTKTMDNTKSAYSTERVFSYEDGRLIKIEETVEGNNSGGHSILNTEFIFRYVMK